LCCGNNENDIIMTSTAFTATVFTDSDGVTHDFEYQTVEELFDALEVFIGKDYPMDEDIMITLADGQKYYWDWLAIRYYYGKGRISFDEMLDMMKGDAL